eukprot:m.225768 g.225768  ORF g.225768 m.225768 type:complete len:57 (+) comp40019_c0_seq3:231-401(+)
MQRKKGEAVTLQSVKSVNEKSLNWYPIQLLLTNQRRRIPSGSRGIQIKCRHLGTNA